MAVYCAPKEWTECVESLAAALDGRSRCRLPLLLLGAVFAGGRAADGDDVVARRDTATRRS